MCITYIRFHQGLSAQNIPRSSLPYIGWAQPYCAWAGMILMILTVLFYGYTTFLPGYWTVSLFFSYYLMVGVCPILYVFWKVVKKTKFVKASEMDLVWERPTIDAYEASFDEPPLGFWEELTYMSGIKKKRAITHVE